MRHIFETYLELLDVLEGFSLEEEQDYYFYQNTNYQNKEKEFTLKIYQYNLQITVFVYFKKDTMTFFFNEKHNYSFSYDVKDIDRIKELLRVVLYSFTQVNYYINNIDLKIGDIMEGEN